MWDLSKMRKIAISITEGNVSEHFGRCEEFVLVDTENNKVISENKEKNPGHKLGFLPKFLEEKGIDIVLTGGIGNKAIDIFNEFGIKVYSGIKGDYEDVIDKFLKGEIKQKKNLCRH